MAEDQHSKWYVKSLTVWSAISGFAATLLPTLGPLVGIDVSSGDVAELSEHGKSVIMHVDAAIVAVWAAVSFVATIYGRIRARAPLALSRNLE